MFFIAAWSYAFCVNFVPAYRDPIDSLGGAKIGVQNTGSDEERVSDFETEKGGITQNEHTSTTESKEVRGL